MTTATKTPSSRSGRKQTSGLRVIRWIETHCVFTSAEWIGKPFRLLPWQKRLLLDLFEMDGERRRYRWALVGVPKKNGKTELAAALALYFLLGDNESAPLVVCAAASDEQADLVFGAARTMAEMSPTLRHVTERFEKEILVPSSPGAKLKRVAAAAGTNDGQNIHAVICDELHEWGGTKGEQVWNVLTNGLGARKQPMVLQITTAGYDLTTILGRQYEYARQGNDPRYYFHWSQAPSDADWRDPATWEMANPSYGITVQPDFFADQLKKPESVFRRYFLNQWVASEDMWLPAGAWDACRSDLALSPERPTYVGIDFAPRKDSTAVVVAQRVDTKTVLRARVWTNPHLPGTPEHNAYQTNKDAIAQYLRELRKAYPRFTRETEDGGRPDGPLFLYDPYRFEDKAEELRIEGLNITPFPQVIGRLVPASETFYELIINRHIAHDGDPTLADHVGNVVKEPKERGWRMTKPKGSPKHIDAAMAAAFAVYEANRVDQPVGLGVSYIPYEPEE